MKKFVLVLMFVGAVACAQDTKSAFYRAPYTDSTAATTAWDSVYVGGSYFKVVIVVHDGTTGTLFVATEDDTTAGRIIPLKVTAYGPESIEIPTHARWVRRKASTGTIANRVIVRQPEAIR